jgi:hypothetical protein
MKWIGERISYVDKDEKTTIVITPANTGWQKSLMGAWFGMWTVIGGVMIWAWVSGYAFSYKPEDTQQIQIIILIFMAFWLYYFVRVGRAFLWIMIGKEMLKVDKIAFTVKNSIRNYGKAKEYYLENIEKVRVSVPKEASFQSVWESSAWIRGGERLEFDYMGKTIRFGRKLTEKEAKALFQVLTKRIGDHLRRK